MLRYVMVAVILAPLLIAEPASACPPTPRPCVGYNYAGQRTGIVVTGIWTYFDTPPVTVIDSGSQVAHWIGKANANLTQWLQTGWIVYCGGGCSNQWFYVEYVDYAGSHSIPTVWGTASGTIEYAVWGDASGGSDGIGPYFNNYVNMNSGPGSSPTWTSRLTDLWHPNTDANGEVYNNTSTPEDIGDGHFGRGPGFDFLDLAAYDGSGTIWSLWDTRTTPQFAFDYNYEQFVQWYHFRIWR
jgi:hypothetical protein